MSAQRWHLSCTMAEAVAEGRQRLLRISFPQVLFPPMAGLATHTLAHALECMDFSIVSCVPTMVFPFPPDIVGGGSLYYFDCIEQYGGICVWVAGLQWPWSVGGRSLPATTATNTRGPGAPHLLSSTTPRGTHESLVGRVNHGV